MRTLEVTPSIEPLLDELAAGEPVEIRRGIETLAYVFPAKNGHDAEKSRQAVEDIKRLRKGVRLNGLKIKDLIEEGRR